MKPGARTQAVIDLLDGIFPLNVRHGGGRGLPPDRLLKRWARANRYAGSKDRRAIQALFYDVLRNLGPLLTAFGEESSPRICVAAVLARNEDPVGHFTGETHTPAPLREDERSRLDQVRIDWTAPNAPEWQQTMFAQTWGERAPSIMRALNEKAALDVRVNLRRASRDDVLNALGEAGIEAAPLSWCPTALRILSPTRIEDLDVFRRGLIEVQDAGSQMIAVLSAAEAVKGAHVLDFCAGAGGKTLALIDALEAPGRIMASDIDGKRLARMTPRLDRIGNPGIDREAQTPDMIKAWAEQFDLVLVDAPCSGAGAWARDPLAPWQLSEDMFEGLLQTQAHVLNQAARCVKPGGVLAYVTCSVFAAENQRQAEAFLNRHPGFTVHVPRPGIFKALGLSPEIMAKGELTIAPDQPPGGTQDGETSDGFYLAMFKQEGQTP